MYEWSYLYLTVLPKPIALAGTCRLKLFNGKAIMQQNGAPFFLFQLKVGPLKQPRISPLCLKASYANSDHTRKYLVDCIKMFYNSNRRQSHLKPPCAQCLK